MGVWCGFNFFFLRESSSEDRLGLFFAKKEEGGYEKGPFGSDAFMLK
jgi:hypothetical protein